MSEYVDIKTEFKNAEALAHALADTLKVGRQDIEIHAEAQPLTAYYERDDGTRSAHVICRGRRSNRKNPIRADAGFIRGADGKYTAVLDETEWWEGRVNQLRQNYAFHAIRLQQQQRGRTVTRQMIGGKMHVTVQGYR
jgi:hypothetical protein